MKLFGYSISLNVLILIGILYLIMIVNALSCSCNMEGFKSSAERKRDKKEKKQDEADVSMVTNTSQSTMRNVEKELSDIQRSTATSAQKILRLDDLNNYLRDLGAKLNTVEDRVDDDYAKQFNMIRRPLMNLASRVNDQIRREKDMNKK